MSISHWFLDQNHFFLNFSPRESINNLTFLKTQTQPTLVSIPPAPTRNGQILQSWGGWGRGGSSLLILMSLKHIASHPRPCLSQRMNFALHHTAYKGGCGRYDWLPISLQEHEISVPIFLNPPVPLQNLHSSMPAFLKCQECGNTERRNVKPGTCSRAPISARITMCFITGSLHPPQHYFN